MKIYRVFSGFLIFMMLLSFASTPARAVTAASADAAQKVDLPALSRTSVNMLNLPFLVKTADSGDVFANDVIGFYILVSNKIAVPLTNVVVRDQLDPTVGWTVNSSDCAIDETGLLSCLIPTLPVGWTYTIHLSAKSTPAMCGILNNTATAYSNEVPVAEDSATINIHCQSDVSIKKTEEKPSIAAGETARYSLVVTSTGTGPAEGVMLNDNLPNAAGLNWTIDSIDGGGTCQITGSVLSCDFGTLNPGEVRTVVISSPTLASQCIDINNTATVTSTNEDAAKQSDNTDSGTITLYCTTLRVEKLADAELVNANDPVGFTITVTNSGTTEARSVVLSDPLPAGVTWSQDNSACQIEGGVLSCSFGNLAGGASAVVHLSGMSSAAVCGTMTNTATAQAENISQPSEDTATIEIKCMPKLSVVKSPEKTEVAAGSAIRFTHTVTNTGSAPAENVVLSDPLPTGSGLSWSYDSVSAGGICSIDAGVLNCSFGTLQAGQSAGVRVSTVSNPQTCGYMVNTVTVASSNAGSVSDITELNVICGPNVKITKTAERAEVTAGNKNQPARFFIKVSSNGTSTATGVKLSDPLPGLNGLNWAIDSVIGGGSCLISGGTLTCNFGSLAAGQERTVVVSARPSVGVFCKPDAERLIQNTATVSAANEPIDAEMDNTAYASIFVLCTSGACEAPDGIYTNNFDTASPGPAFWSAYPITTSPNGTQTFLGEFSNGDIRFTYPDTEPTGHHMIKVSFDLYIIRSWDGNKTRNNAGQLVGEDRWQFRLLNAADQVSRTYVDTTFTNYVEPRFKLFRQSYPGSFPGNPLTSDNLGKTGSVMQNSMGYQFVGPRDSTYHFVYYIPHTDQTVKLSFNALGLQVVGDESWGIDNFELRLMRCNTELSMQNTTYIPLVINTGGVFAQAGRIEVLPEVPSH